MKNEKSNYDFNKSYDTFSKEYNQIGSLEEVKKEEKPGRLKRKYIRIKDAMKRFWAVGKTGFQLGAYAGGALGFILGAYESFRIKSFLPLPLAIIGTGFSFGFIFAISTVVRSHPNNNENKKYYFETMFYDSSTNSYIQKSIPFHEHVALNEKC